ncbi:MAG: DUF983 domain-containing protein [Crocinitomicaceae bacterium]
MSRKIRSIWSSLFGLKCPRCRKGNLFVKGGLFQYKKILDMPENCSVCKQKFDIEPGFWIGAMWISYPIVVVIEMPFLFLALFAEGAMTWAYFGFMVLAFLVLWPLILRLGRSSWIHVSIRYEEDIKE